MWDLITFVTLNFRGNFSYLPFPTTLHGHTMRPFSESLIVTLADGSQWLRIHNLQTQPDLSTFLGVTWQNCVLHTKLHPHTERGDSITQWILSWILYSEYYQNTCLTEHMGSLGARGLQSKELTFRSSPRCDLILVLVDLLSTFTSNDPG